MDGLVGHFASLGRFINQDKKREEADRVARAGLATTLLTAGCGNDQEMVSKGSPV